MKTQQKAFTLFEVLIALGILAGVWVFVMSTISNALTNKKKIQTEVEDVSSLRDAMKIMRADINLAYHHFDFENEISKSAKSNKTNNANINTQQNQTSNTNTQTRQNTRQSPDTHFLGEKEKINFVTLNNGRYLANEQQADFIEVGYSLKDCKNLTTDKNSQCLFRRIGKIADRDPSQGGTESVLLENVKSFSVKYIGDGKKEWVEEWKSLGGTDDSAKGKFPDAVEITLSIEREQNNKKREYSLQYVIPIHNPNNPTRKSTNSGTTSGANGSEIQPPTFDPTQSGNL